MSNYRLSLNMVNEEIVIHSIGSGTYSVGYDHPLFGVLADELTERYKHAKVENVFRLETFSKILPQSLELYARKRKIDEVFDDKIRFLRYAKPGL